MDNPHELPAPDDPIERVHAFARDLAYGAVHGLWRAAITTRFLNNEIMYWEIATSIEQTNALQGLVAKKWDKQAPTHLMLIAFGYFMQHSQSSYFLTEKAFALLEQPATPASVFISYSRAESSAFALLILARFKAVGLAPFLDIQDLKPGDDWHAALEREVKERDNFICLIGKKTLDSKYVRKEIEWAAQSDKPIRIIPLWHNHFQYDEDKFAELRDILSRNAIIVENENPKAYNGAIVELLNLFGYTPS